MPEPSRRQALQAVAALATTAWAADDIDPADEPQESRPYGAAGYTVNELEGVGLVTSVRSCCMDVSLADRDEFEATKLGVYHDGGTVQVDLDGQGEKHHGGTLATLDPEQAREVAVAIYMAAEEASRWEA